MRGRQEVVPARSHKPSTRVRFPFALPFQTGLTPSFIPLYASGEAIPLSRERGGFDSRQWCQYLVVV